MPKPQEYEPGKQQWQLFKKLCRSDLKSHKGWSILQLRFKNSYFICDQLHSTSVTNHPETTNMAVDTSTIQVNANHHSHLGIQLCKIILSRQGTRLWSDPRRQAPCLHHSWTRGRLTPSGPNFIQYCQQIYNCVILAKSTKPKVTWN